MQTQFHSIGIAITFSPSILSLLRQAELIRSHNNATLTIIHAGRENPADMQKLNTMIEKTIHPHATVEIIWQDDDPVDLIRSVCKKKNIDLLIFGALVREDIVTYFTGSVARDLMRNAPCSLLILTSSNNELHRFRKICASVDFSDSGERVLRQAYNFAQQLGGEELILVKELMLTGLAITINDSGSIHETEEMREQWKKNEETKLELMIKELHITEIATSAICLYGKQGWEVTRFAREANCNLLVIGAPEKKLNLLDRIFQHDQEFIYRELPCSLFMVK